MTIEEIVSLVTPTALCLLVLVVVIKLQRDVNPIVLSIVKGLTLQAQSNSIYFAMMALVGANIFFGASADEARLLGYAKIASCAKVLSLTCGGILAYMIKTSFSPPTTSTIQSDKQP